MTRLTTLMIGVLLAILAASVAAQAQAQAQAQTQTQTHETRLFTDDLGNEVEIPVRPQRIVSLRGEQFTAPLIELGAPLVGSSGLTNPDVNRGRPFVRGAYDLFGFDFEGSGVAWVGSPGEPDLEAIAALEPDLIFITDWQADLRDRLDVIAPTVVIGIWSNPMLERYRKIADAAGRLDAFEAGLAAYTFKRDRAREVVADAVGDPGAVSVAIAEVFGEEFYVYRDYAAISQVLRDLGVSMPDAIAGIEGGNAPFSPELLPEIDADFLIGTYTFTFDGQTPSDRLAAWDALIPGWDRVLHAPRHDQHILLDREPMRALSFRALETTLAILLTHLATRDFVPLRG